MAPDVKTVENLRAPKWDGGAYARGPHIVAVRNQEPHVPSEGAVAYIESWLGTIEEFLSVVTSLAASSPSGTPQVRSQIGFTDARSVTVSSLDELQSSLSREGAASILTIRVEITEPHDAYFAAVILAPGAHGLRVEVLGRDRARSLGAAQVAFERMMIGYVDRMGGWRGLAWMVSALAPLLLFSLGISLVRSNVWVPILFLSVGLVSSFAVFTTMYSVLLFPSGATVVEHLRESARVRHARTLRGLMFHTWTRRVLSWCGALLIGVLGSKLADLLPWL